jgi:maltose-binding protein MalE
MAAPASAAAPASMAAPASAAAAASVAPLTGSLTLWEAYGASGGAEITAFEKILGNVQAANPGLQVTRVDIPFNNLFTKFETSAANSGVPDLYIAPNDSMAKEARAGLLADLTSYLPQLSNISPAAIQADTVDGKLYAIPESLKGVALFYNTALLPTPPVTTDDWLKDASKLGWVYGPNGGGSYYLWGLFQSFGGTILDPTTGKCAATANSGVADALGWLQKAKAAGLHMYQNDTAAAADFVSGKIAGFIDGPWQSGNFEKALGSKLAVAPGPTGPKGAFGPLVAPDGYYINKNSANVALAVQFAIQMDSQANEQIFADEAGHIPAIAGVTYNNPISQGFANAYKTGFPRPTARQLDNYWTPFGNALAAVIDKGTAPASAVATACQQMDKANGL